MKMMIMGDNLQFVKVDENTCELTPSEWLSNKARKQKRSDDGRFRRGDAPKRRLHERGRSPFKRLFVLAKEI